jgi:hypothetical protein
MSLGKKTGGRIRGTPNKRTLEIQDRLCSMGCDPIQGMADLAMDANNTPELRGRMYAELAQYIAPKRKAVEHLRGEEQSITFNLNLKPEAI